MDILAALSAFITCNAYVSWYPTKYNVQRPSRDSI